ncbi:MAG: flagellar basal body-associated FliL family protein [Phycisphaerae bacterium]
MGGAFLGMMVIEAVVVFVLVRNFSGGPQAAEAHGPTPGINLTEGARKPEEVELEVVKLTAQNERSQRLVEYSMEIYVSVADADQEKLADLLKRRKATIQDRLTRVIRAAEPERFTEPDLKTLRKQIQNELAGVVGDDKMIREVLIPSIVSDER